MMMVVVVRAEECLFRDVTMQLLIGVDTHVAYIPGIRHSDLRVGVVFSESSVAHEACGMFASDYG